MSKLFKTLLIGAAVVLTASMVSCKKSAEDIQKQIEDLGKEYKEAVEAGDTEKAEKIKKEIADLAEELMKLKAEEMKEALSK